MTRSIVPPCSLSPKASRLDHGRHFAEFEDLFRRGGGEQVHGAGDDSRPAGLMVGAEPGTVVAVKVFVELEAVTPVWVLLELCRGAVNRAATVLPFQKNAAQTVRDFFGNLIEVHLPAGAGRTLDREPVAV